MGVVKEKVRQSSQTVQLTELEKKRQLSLFAVIAWTSNFFFHFYNAFDVSSLNDLIW